MVSNIGMSHPSLLAPLAVRTTAPSCLSTCLAAGIVVKFASVMRAEKDFKTLPYNGSTRNFWVLHLLPRERAGVF